MLPPNQYFLLLSKDEWDIKEDSGKSRIHYVYCSMSKCTSQAEATSNSKDIKPSIVELCLAEGISQSVSRISQSFSKLIDQSVS